MLIAIISDAYRAVKTDMAQEKESDQSKFIKKRILRRIPLTRHFLPINHESSIILEKKEEEKIPLLSEEKDKQTSIDGGMSVEGKEMNQLLSQAMQLNAEEQSDIVKENQMMLILQEIVQKMSALDSKIETLSGQVASMDKLLKSNQ